MKKPFPIFGEGFLWDFILNNPSINSLDNSVSLSIN